MRVAKWGNSLAIRLPKIVVEAMGLKEGDDLKVHAAGAGSAGISLEKADREAFLARLRTFEGRLPADFTFDRDEANRRD